MSSFGQRTMRQYTPASPRPIAHDAARRPTWPGTFMDLARPLEMAAPGTKPPVYSWPFFICPYWGHASLTCIAPTVRLAFPIPHPLERRPNTETMMRLLVWKPSRPHRRIAQWFRPPRLAHGKALTGATIPKCVGPDRWVVVETDAQGNVQPMRVTPFEPRRHLRYGNAARDFYCTKSRLTPIPAPKSLEFLVRRRCG